ncbi:hypothetical protein HUU61_14520 [Rhodopseudomonas palustris]|nr:hypothetical protein [Rhodopseudomonas palustris]
MPRRLKLNWNIIFSGGGATELTIVLSLEPVWRGASSIADSPDKIKLLDCRRISGKPVIHCIVTVAGCNCFAPSFLRA